ncbi:MAG: AMP-binding protein [Alphaproteobacteria bacterium]|nr:AMP-binding protein [Alphaproteobacteria bacterium]
MNMNSHVIGAKTPAKIGLTIGQALDEAAKNWPTQPALIDCAQNIRFNWAELLQRSNQLASGFLALGLKPGERIGIWSLNRYEWALTQFAAAKAGLVLVTINPAYRLSELEFSLAKVKCAALILAPKFKTSDYIGMVQTLIPEMADAIDGKITSPRLPALRHMIQLGGEAAQGAIAFAAIEQRGKTADPQTLKATEATLNPDDIINIQYTSGTTGSPKGVMLSHANILNNGYFCGEAIELTSVDKICIAVPLYHCFGMVIGNLACLTHGAAMVFVGEGFDPIATLKAVADEKCTALFGVPTMFIAELEHEDFANYDLSSLRTGVMAGSPCPMEIMQQVTARMNMHDLTICYGMTETSPVSFQSSTKDSLEMRVSTVGRIHPHVEVKIIDQNKQIVPRCVAGELCTRGYSVMLGYWDDSEQTAQVIDTDGWLHSGDIATIDEQGFCKIVGRIKDLVIRGGENLYPREIEEYLYKHAAIRDVQVFGVPDKKYVEALAVWVILHPNSTLTAAGLQDFCQGQIAHQKIPTHIKFVQEFPMTVTGKIQKFLMREAMMEELGLSET